LGFTVGVLIYGSFFRVTANFLGLNSPRSARSSEKRFINFFSSLRDLRVFRGESSVPILSGYAALS
jgi:hypothetical protein